MSRWQVPAWDSNVVWHDDLRLRLDDRLEVYRSQSTPYTGFAVALGWGVVKPSGGYGFEEWLRRGVRQTLRRGRRVFRRGCKAWRLDRRRAWTRLATAWAG